MSDDKPAGFKDHFSTHASSYVAARPTYPPELFEWLATQVDARKCAWDAATGNGQAAVAMAGHFDRVVATDASAAQIENAIPCPNVEYCVAPSEDSGIDEQSCDLVTVAQALHWFDVDAFWTEVRRVLKPGGIVAAWGYQLTRITPDIDHVIDIFDKEIIGPYWPPERLHVDSRYGSLNFPFSRLDSPVFTMSIAWSRKQFLDYIGTWSAARRYRSATNRDPLVWLENAIKPYWTKGETMRVTWPMFLLVGKVRT